MIEFKNVSKKYKNGTHALENVNLKVEDGEFVYIMGPTGSGKSTLVKLLDGEEIPTGGSVIVNGIDVGRLRKSKVYLYRRKIGVVFQDYRLLQDRTVSENIQYALEVLDLPDKKIKKRTRDVLKLVELSDKAKMKPKEISGGQQQRAAIARAISKRPAILIADEPTGNLDPKMTEEMVTLLERINKEEKTTVLVVTHNDVMVEYHPKRTIRLEAGHIVDDGTHTESFYKQNFGKAPEEKEEAAGNETAETAAEVPAEEEAVEVKKEHDLSESEKQDQAISEITMSLEAIKELTGGDRE